MNHRTSLRVSAILFAALYVVAMFLPSLPDGTDSDSRVLSLVNDGVPIVLGGSLLAAAGLAALWFVSLLAGSLASARSTSSRLMEIGGGGYGVILMVASTFFSSIATGRAIGELPPAEDAYLVRAVSNQGFHLVLVPGLLCAGLLILAASLMGRREDLLPGWCVTLGYCLVPLLLLGAAWAPQFLVPMWAVVVAFTVRERRGLQSEISASSLSAAV